MTDYTTKNTNKLDLSPFSRGGDGVVIISYPTGSLTATGGTITTSGTSTIHTFTASSTFTITASNNIATTTEPEKLVDLTYTYDPVGNILTRVDNSHFVGGQTTTYSYDNLDRLLTASTTGFTSYAPLYTSFAYDALGNITSTTGTTTTTYTYAQTGYTNPHAPTSIAGVTYTYDNNGNLTAQGSKSFTWDYANRITQSVGSGATTTYGYDFAGSRMFQTVGSTTTRYPSRNYSIVQTTNGATTTATSTEYIFLGDLLVATVDQALVNGTATGSPTTSYVHADHLGSTAAVTNASGTPVQRLDYLPFGGTRVSAGSAIEKRQYIGEFTDNSGLSYLNARYYDSARGQFTSQDPVFWEIGVTRDGTGILATPQAQNSYAYGNNNPIANKDPNGRLVILIDRPVLFPNAPLSRLNNKVAHSFIAIIPVDPSSIGSSQGINTSQPFTLSATLNEQTGALVKSPNGDVGYLNSLGMNTTCAKCGAVVIAPPAGLTNSEFERKLVSTYNSMSDTLASNYGELGGEGTFWGHPNSNNAATDILTRSGVSMNTVRSAKSQMFSQNGMLSPGFGTNSGGSATNRAIGFLTQIRNSLQGLAASLKSSAQR